MLQVSKIGTMEQFLVWSREVVRELNSTEYLLQVYTQTQVLAHLQNTTSVLVFVMISV